jgi:hypothetical protein
MLLRSMLVIVAPNVASMGVIVGSIARSRVSD